jgi:hypothetical protein
MQNSICSVWFRFFGVIGRTAPSAQERTQIGQPLVFFLRVIRSLSVALLHQVPGPDGVSFAIAADFQGFGISGPLSGLRLAKVSERR